jgi:ATP-binding cassette subfamily B protein
MLVRLLSDHLRPYRAVLAAVVVLQLFGTIASLYLPTLNADIIDNGISKGDTGYIIRIGAWMLAVTIAQVVCSAAAVYFGARASMGFGRDVRAALFR